MYWISATSYFLDKVIVAFCLTMSDSEPVQLVEKKKNPAKNSALEDAFQRWSSC